MSVLSTLITVREEIANRLNESETDNFDAYTTWAMTGLREIHQSFPNNNYYYTSADITLSSGTRSYSLPTAFEKMDSVTYPGKDKKLSYVPPEQFDMLQPSAAEAGDPGIYTIRNHAGTPYMEFYYAPNGSIVLHYNYYRIPNVISAGSATIDMPIKYSELLVLYGVKQGLRRKGKWTEASEISNEYEVMKQRMIMDLMNMSNENYGIRSVREIQRGGSDIDPSLKAFWRA